MYTPTCTYVHVCIYDIDTYAYLDVYDFYQQIYRIELTTKIHQSKNEWMHVYIYIHTYVKEHKTQHIHIPHPSLSSYLAIDLSIHMSCVRWSNQQLRTTGAAGCDQDQSGPREQGTSQWLGFPGNGSICRGHMVSTGCIHLKYTFRYYIFI